MLYGRKAQTADGSCIFNDTFVVESMQESTASINSFSTQIQSHTLSFLQEESCLRLGKTKNQYLDPLQCHQHKAHPLR